MVCFNWHWRPIVQDNQRCISLIHDLHIWTPLTSEHLWIHCHHQSHHPSCANFLSGWPALSLDDLCTYSRWPASSLDDLCNYSHWTASSLDDLCNYSHWPASSLNDFCSIKWSMCLHLSANNYCVVEAGQWSTDYETQLSSLNTPSLATRRCRLKLSLLYNIVNNNVDFPFNPMTYRHYYPHRHVNSSACPCSATCSLYPLPTVVLSQYHQVMELVE